LPLLAFSAKEPNHNETPKAADFRDEWRNGNSIYPFAYRIAEWAFGILEGFKEPLEAVYPFVWRPDTLFGIYPTMYWSARKND
jgi:hypothetical protein